MPSFNNLSRVVTAAVGAVVISTACLAAAAGPGAVAAVPSSGHAQVQA